MADRPRRGRAMLPAKLILSLAALLVLGSWPVPARRLANDGAQRSLNPAAEEGRRSAPVANPTTKEIYSDADFGVICNHDSIFRKRLGSGGEKNANCLREWSVLIMSEGDEAALLASIKRGAAQATGEEEQHSASQYPAISCRDVEWVPGPGTEEAAPCASLNRSHYIAPMQTAEPVRARWVVEQRDPLQVRWLNDHVIGASKPDASELKRSVLASSEDGKALRKAAWEAMVVLIDEQELTLSGVIKSAYESLPNSKRALNELGEPQRYLPPDVAERVRSDYLKAASEYVDRVSGRSLTKIAADSNLLMGISVKQTLTTDDVLLARNLRAAVEVDRARIKRAIDDIIRPELTAHLKSVALAALSRELSVQRAEERTSPAEARARAPRAPTMPKDLVTIESLEASERRDEGAAPKADEGESAGPESDRDPATEWISNVLQSVNEVLRRVRASRG